MNLSKHARTRKRQRGFSSFSLDIIEKFGRCERVPGGATRIFFGKKEYQRAVAEFKKVIQLLDKAKNGSLIIADDTKETEDTVITVYKNSDYN
jgi:hypothetical protein